jgi:hypothetical protein
MENRTFIYQKVFPHGGFMAKIHLRQKTPSGKRKKEIQDALHEPGKELSRVEFV